MHCARLSEITGTGPVMTRCDWILDAPLPACAGTCFAGHDSLSYSAASRCGSIFSTLAAQNLNSGILPKGSSFGLVRRFAAAST